jgi:2-polyprenyl-3-methyl-5-hydroxy-6-metoxy-1,4-benzoquinol methylase
MESRKSPDQLVKDQWDANSKEWALQVRGGEDVYRERFLEPAFMSFVGKVDGLDVLDGGCGEGTSSRVLARANARVSAVDLSAEMIANASSFESAGPLGIEYHQASVEEMPFPDGRFDLVTCWMALSDMSCYAGAMREFARVLKPGGKLVFCIRHPCYFTSRMAVVRRSKAEAPFLLVGDYFRDTPWLEKWSFAGGNQEAGGQLSFSNTRFPYTLSDCINGVLGAGLSLLEIREPRPGEDLCEQLPRLWFWNKHAALYLFVSAVKGDVRLAHAGPGGA